jgi:hypothetical protein
VAASDLVEREPITCRVLLEERRASQAYRWESSTDTKLFAHCLRKALFFQGDKNFKRHFRFAAPAGSGSPSTRRQPAAVDCRKAWRDNARPGQAAEDA